MFTKSMQWYCRTGDGPKTQIDDSPKKIQLHQFSIIRELGLLKKEERSGSSQQGEDQDLVASEKGKEDEPLSLGVPSVEGLASGMEKKGLRTAAQANTSCLAWSGEPGDPVLY